MCGGCGHGCVAWLCGWAYASQERSVWEMKVIPVEGSDIMVAAPTDAAPPEQTRLPSLLSCTMVMAGLESAAEGESV